MVKRLVFHTKEAGSIPAGVTSVISHMITSSDFRDLCNDLDSYMSVSNKHVIEIQLAIQERLFGSKTVTNKDGVVFSYSVDRAPRRYEVTAEVVGPQNQFSRVEFIVQSSSSNGSTYSWVTLPPKETPETISLSPIDGGAGLVAERVISILADGLRGETVPTELISKA